MGTREKKRNNVRRFPAGGFLMPPRLLCYSSWWHQMESTMYGNTLDVNNGTHKTAKTPGRRDLMIPKCCLFVLFFCTAFLPVDGAAPFESDIHKTSLGNLKITFIGHGTLMFECNGKVIHIDPVRRYADYTTMPKADLILVTHEHGDHFDLKAIAQITKEGTQIVLTKICAGKLGKGLVMKNGDTKTVAGLKIKAVPAYNIVHMRRPGSPFHPKGDGNGYIITFGKTRVYVAGDTENIPEMAKLKKIDIAFLPMNLPYTMTPEMVRDAALMFKPKILYPYHFGKTDTSKLVALMKPHKEVEVRIRKLQ